MEPLLDHAERAVAILATVPSAILCDNPVRIEEHAHGMGEAETAAGETCTVLVVVPFDSTAIV